MKFEHFIFLQKFIQLFGHSKFEARRRAFSGCFGFKVFFLK